MSTGGDQAPAAEMSSSWPPERQSDSWKRRFIRSWSERRSRNGSNWLVGMPLSPILRYDGARSGAPENETVLPGVDLDPIPGLELPGQELHRQGVHDPP